MSMRTHGQGRAPGRSRPLSVFFHPAAWLVLALLLAACSGRSAVAPGPPPGTNATQTVFVTSNGWHSSIVLARSLLPADRIPEIADFPEARFLEFGWGDAEYYPAERATIGMTLRAALVPTPAVLHVAGMGVSPERRYPKAEVIALSLDAVSLGGLVDFIAGSFERGTGTRADAIGPGLYPTSRFYPATGRFHLGNTCNTWTANALKHGGFAVSGTGTTRAEDLMVQVRRLPGRP